VTHRGHDHDLLGGYALGRLDPDETRTVDAHLAGCTRCRRELTGLAATRNSLAEVPAEAFLDGPPEGGDLLLRRTLRAVRDDNARNRRQRITLIAAGVMVLATVAAGAGVLAGRGQAQRIQAWHGVRPPLAGADAAPGANSSAPAPGVRVSSSAPAPGVRVSSATDPRTGATIRTTVTTAAGWVRVHAEVRGIKAGKRCQLSVVARGGASVVAGSWLVSSVGEAEGTSLDGSALVAADDVAAVEVVTFDNEKLVSAII
jgi:anti-sigma factor RsiW